MDKGKLSELSGRYREAIVQRIWDQWTAIGGGGYSKDSRSIPWAIDPEALLLATSNFFEVEPRLRDTALSWILKQGELISLARMRRMQKEFEFGDERQIAEFAAAILVRNPSMRAWNTLAASKAEGAKSAPRDIVSPFRPEEPSCLILKLRSLLGVNSRVEILFYLYHSERSQISNIATAVVWNKKTVQRTLNEMVLSGHVFAEREGWPTTVYHIKNAEWEAFFPTKNYRDWETIHLGQHFFYRGVFECLKSLRNCCLEGVTEAAAKFLIVESFSKAYYLHQRAGHYLTRETYSAESLEDMVEHVVASAEGSEKWPVGAFAIDPNRTVFE